MDLIFDAKEVGLAEVGWWKAHNEHNKPELLRLLIKYHVLFYSLKTDEAKMVLTPLFEATQYHDTHNWNKALEKVKTYYESIQKITQLNFNPLKATKLEVGWWKLHDELEFTKDKKPLAKTFASLYATIFGLENSKLLKAGELKAKATHEHDLAEDSKTPKEEIENHWKKAGELLVSFYKELKRVAPKPL